MGYALETFFRLGALSAPSPSSSSLSAPRCTGLHVKFAGVNPYPSFLNVPSGFLMRTLYLVAVLIAASQFPTAYSQHTYEVTYREVVEQLTELPSDLDLAALLPYEKTQLRYLPPRTVSVAAGYDDARGFYDVREVADPHAGLPEWRERVSKRFVNERQRSYVLDEDGEVLADNAVAPTSERTQLLEREAAAGGLDPFRRGLLPSEEEMSELLASGFRVVGSQTAVIGRNAVPNESGSVGRTSRGVGLSPSLVLSDGKTEFAFDSVALIETATVRDGSGAVTYYRATQYEALQSTSGEDLLAVARELTSRPDTLISGVVVAKTAVRTRSNYGYVRDGINVLRDTKDGSHHELVVFPNPVIAHRASVILPDGVAGVARVSVFDQTGREVSTQTFGSTQSGLLPIELPADLPSGTYYLGVQLGSTSYNHAIVVY